MRLSGKLVWQDRHRHRGTTGIGFATARRLLADGVEKLVIAGQDDGRLAEAARELGSAVTPVRADVRRLADLPRLADAARQALGPRLDVLFANAGVGSFAPIEAVDEQVYDQPFGVNVKGLFLTVQALAPLMARGRASS